MYVILAYDINKKRISKVRKICMRYLRPVQKSVFEGHLTEKNLKQLEDVLEKIIVSSEDSVLIYRFDSLKYASKDVLGRSVVNQTII